MHIKKWLIRFEKNLATSFGKGIVTCPIHLAGGNEDVLINIFKHIRKDDYVFSTHRNHYHYILHTSTKSTKQLEREIYGYENAICKGRSRSMHTIDHKHHFYSSAIVAGCVAIACGVALALKMKETKQRVWCFIGDGACDSGHTYEAVRYTYAQDLPITFIVEDNDRSVVATKEQRWGKDDIFEFDESTKVIYYNYKPTYPHVGIGKDVSF